MGNRDNRTQAELLLAPREPLSRNMAGVGALKLNLGGTAVPGVISSSTQLAGPVRNIFSALLKNKTLVEGLSVAVTAVLAGFDKQRAQLQAGTFVPRDPLLTPVANGIPDVASFFSFSTLHPGQRIPSSFNALIEQRKRQLQQLSRSLSSVFSAPSAAGVSVVENTNPQPYPHANQIDVPDVPRLAQGGKTAQGEAILKDKTNFLVRGVTIGAGKPHSWSRLTSVLTSIPNFSSTVNQVFKDRHSSSTWSEPPSAYAAQFPYNHVQQTESGHAFELDDTPGAERVHIFHRAGSFIEMHPDGSVVYKNAKHGYHVTMADHHVKVNGACHVAVDGNSTLYVKGNVEMQTDGDFRVQAKGDFNVFAKNINLRAKKTFKGDGTKIDLRYIVLPYNISFETPTGVPFPRVNLGAMMADFPNSNFSDVASSIVASDPIGHGRSGTMPVNFGDVAPVVFSENPLSNWSAYTAQTPEAIAYRAKFFDTPEEVNDVEMYSGHTVLQSNLGDITPDARRLAGSLRTITTGVAEPATKPTTNYLNFDDYKGTFDYPKEYALGGTSFLLSDVADLALYPDALLDITPTSDDNFEDTPDDGNNFTGGNGDGTGGPNGDGTNPDTGPEPGVWDGFPPINE